MALPKLYEQITWVNDTTPALNEDNLNAMSQALEDIDNRVVDVASTIMEDVPKIEEALKHLDPPIRVEKDYAPIQVLTDAIDKPVIDLKVKVDPIQDLHGYDKPWVGGAGKNLLPLTLANLKAINTDGSWSGNTYSYNSITFAVQTDSADNVTGIKVNSSGASAQTVFYIENGNSTYFNSVAGKSVVMNGAPSGSSTSNYCLNAWIQNGSGGTETGSGRTLTYPSTEGGHNLAIMVYSGATASNVLFKPMVSTSGGTFEPSTNICPITGWTEANVYRTGKQKIVSTNLKDTDSHANFTITKYDGGRFSFLGNNGSSTYGGVLSTDNTILLRAGHTYRLKGNWSNITPSESTIRFDLRYHNGGSTTAIYMNENDESYTPTVDTYCSLGYRISGNYSFPVGATASPCLTMDDTDTSYEPYQGEVFTIDLDGTRYGGVLDVDAGTLTLDRAYVRKNAFDYKSSTPYNNVFRMGVLSNCQNGAAISDKFEQSVSASSQSIYAFYIGSAYGDGLEVYVGLTLESGINTLEKANTWLSNNGGYIDFVYPLATPQTITLTPTEIDLLFGYNTLFADTGDLSLTYDASGVLRIANAKLDIDTFKSIVAASSDFADFKSRVAAL